MSAKVIKFAKQVKRPTQTVSVDDRLERIRASMEKIDRLLNELRKMNEDVKK